VNAKLSAAIQELTNTVQRAHSTQQLINQVLHRGTPVSMVCPTCNRRTEHRDLKLDSVCYTVCRTCKSMTTNA